VTRANAPARTDLPFLRHRARPRPPVAAPAAQAGPAAPSTARSAAPAAAPSALVHLSRPAAAPTGALDLSAPTAGAPSALLDLSAAPARSPLDLSSPTAAPTRAAAGPSATATPRGTTSGGSAARPLPRARSGDRTLLTAKSPTVTLNRLQSGIGVLSIEAACSAAVGDLRIGAAYQLTDGHSSTVSRSGGMGTAPRNSRRPIIAARREQYERLLVDLRQSRKLDRLIVYGFSESGAEVRWGGTLLVHTAGGARVELPLDQPASRGVAVLLSIYNIRGEFVLRAELETFDGGIRKAVQAYGFDRIAWLDDATPVA